VRNIAVAFVIIFAASLMVYCPVNAQIGRRFPSERKDVTDPVTGAKLIFLTSTPSRDSKIYQTHNQWTSDGQWVIFRSEKQWHIWQNHLIPKSFWTLFKRP
jgi:oligogalacturonide lyase